MVNLTTLNDSIVKPDMTWTEIRIAFAVHAVLYSAMLQRAQYARRFTPMGATLKVTR